MRLLLPAAAIAAGLACTGCSEIRVRTVPEVVSETSLGTRTETVIGPLVTAKVENDGPVPRLAVTRMCEKHAVRDVSRTVRYARYDANARGTRNLGIAGGALTAAGVLLSALPAMPANTDHTADLGAGIPIAGLGLALAASAIAGAAKATGHEEKEELTTVDLGTVEPAKPCKGAANGEEVMGQLKGVRSPVLLMGRTDEEGKLALDLARIPARDLAAAPAPKTLSLFVHESLVAELALPDLERAAEEQAWSRADVQGCISAMTDEACRPLEEYASAYPQGHHAGEVSAALDRAAALRRARREADTAALLALSERQARSNAAVLRRAAILEAASTAARRAAAMTCLLTCRSRCDGRDCTLSCLSHSCDTDLLPPEAVR